MKSCRTRSRLAYLLTRIQGTKVYRNFVMIFRPTIILRLGSKKDMQRMSIELFRQNEISDSQNSSNIQIANVTAWYKDHIVGFGELVELIDGCSPTSKFWIHSLYVHPVFRRMGVGRQIVVALIATAQTYGVKEIFLNVNKQNHAALLLYGKFSFVQIESIEEDSHYFMTDSIILHKIISS